MKIGIITIQRSNNFGAELQAYALQKKLQLMGGGGGYDAENIDYVFYKNPRHLKSKGEKPVIKLSIVNRIKEAIFPILEYVRNLRHRAEMKTRTERFEKWFTANVRTSKEYRSIESLYEAKFDYDVYMVGSDQVWNPRMASNIKPYFLDFAPNGSRCVSYASSIGLPEISSDAFYKYKQLLKKFSAISVREKKAVDIIRAMALGVEVKDVIDPTLLLDSEEWKKVSIKPDDVPGEKYLLLYDLIPSYETVQLAKDIADVRGLKIVRVGDGAYGPGEFVWLFANADFVVTNSFHGTAFSVINNVSFYTVIPKGMTNSSRIESIAQMVGLEGRIVKAENFASADAFETIDWMKVNAKIENVRNKSIDYLRYAIEGKIRKDNPHLPLGCYAVWNTDKNVRAQSTSGGVFRVIAENVIARGGVVYGAAFSSDFHHVVHCSAETIEELVPLMKSKYVWSDPAVAYKDAVAQLRAGRYVLFTGTPCQIAAIKSLAKSGGASNERLLTMDIVCHGTPRPEVFSSYVDELERNYGDKITKYEFRNKDAGWNFSHVKCEFGNGRKYDSILRCDPYYLAFGTNFSLRSSCFNCQFIGLERVSDFTIADCWRVAASHPELDDNRGTSLVFVNTPKAQLLWKHIREEKRVCGNVYDIDLAQLRNMPLQQRAMKPRSYEKFNKVFDETKSFGEASKVFITRKMILKAKLVYLIKKIGWFYFRMHQ